MLQYLRRDVRSFERDVHMFHLIWLKASRVAANHKHGIVFFHFAFGLWVV